MVSRREAHQALKKAYLALPKGTDGDHNVRPPNKPIKLYGGVFEIHQDGIPIKMQGTIEQHWYPYLGVRFKGRPTGKWVPDLGDARLRIPKRFATANVQVTECTQGTRPRASGLISGIVRIGQNRAIRAIKFYLPNFHNYVGNPVRFVRRDRMWGSASRITLSADGWRVFVDQDPEYHKLLDLLKARGGFGVGHVCLLTRSDGSRFKVHEASDFLSTLHFFSHSCVVFGAVRSSSRGLVAGGRYGQNGEAGGYLTGEVYHRGYQSTILTVSITLLRRLGVFGVIRYGTNLCVN